MQNSQANNEWLTVVSMTDEMRRYAELQQWEQVSSLALQRQAQLQLFFARQQVMTTEQQANLVNNVQQLLAADKLFMSAVTEIKNAMDEGLSKINQGRKAVQIYQGCV